MISAEAWAKYLEPNLTTKERRKRLERCKREYHDRSITTLYVGGVGWVSYRATEQPEDEHRRPANRKVTEDEERAIVEHYDRYQSTSRASRHFDRNETTVRRILRRHGRAPNKAAQIAGIQRGYRPVTDDERDRMAAMFRDGMSDKGIAVACNRGRSTVQRILSELGLFEPDHAVHC